MTLENNNSTTTKPQQWTEERVELLKKLWAEGLSASQIALRLGNGVTRNAVIGKVHRLKLSGRASAPRVATPRVRRSQQPSAPARPSGMLTSGANALKPQGFSAPQSRPETQPEPIRLVDIPKGERVNILMLSDKTCRWPLGDPGDENFSFCGHTPKAGTPYCPYHAQIAYQAPMDRRRRTG